jgi:tRNA 2-thiouridine synthesizing protein A
MPETRSLNVMGHLCPLPVLLSAREIRYLQPGDLLEVLGDDPTMMEDLPVWCERAGHRLVEIENDEGVIRALIERGESGSWSGSFPPRP